MEMVIMMRNGSKMQVLNVKVTHLNSGHGVYLTKKDLETNSTRIEEDTD